LLFALMPKRAIISDVNIELINAYEVIRDDVDALIRSLKRHKNEEKYFYHVRKNWNPKKLSKVRRASRFIFLNKTCFNGLYRENSKGEFNVPFGRYKNPNIADENNLRAISEYLNVANVKIMNKDFLSTVRLASAEDFVYFDPPYHPINATASFTKYSKDDFNENNQKELADAFSKLAERNCTTLLSNSNTNLIKSLYKDFDILEVEANRFINCKSENRGKGKYEVLVRSWKKL